MEKRTYFVEIIDYRNDLHVFDVKYPYQTVCYMDYDYLQTFLDDCKKNGDEVIFNKDDVKKLIAWVRA